MEEPWLSKEFQEWLIDFLKESKDIFEFGSGYSTIKLDKLPGNLISVEHDERWYNKISPKIKNSDYKLLHPEEYHESILKYNKEFDLIIIDGIYRMRCLKASLKQIKNNGFIVLDDSERKKYEPIKKLLEKYKKIEIKENEKETTIWEITKKI